MKQLQRLFAAAGWTGFLLIVILSVVPASQRPHTSAPGVFEHALAYGLTGLVLAMGYGKTSTRLMLFFCLASASALFEIIQMWLPGRSAALKDVAASTTGAAVGLIAGAILLSLGLRLVKSDAGDR